MSVFTEAIVTVSTIVS